MIHILKKILMNGFGSISLKISSVLLNIYVARTANMDVFSLYAILTSSIVLFGTTYLNVLSQLCSSNKEKNNSLLYPSIFTLCYLLLICLFFHFFYEGNTKYILCAVLIGIALSAPLLGELYKKGKHKLYALFCTLSFIFFIFTLLIDYFLLSSDIYHYILLYSIPYFTLLISLICYFLIRKKERKTTLNNCIFNFAELGRFTSQGIYLLCASALVPLCFWIIYNVLNEKLGTYTIAMFVTIMQWSWIISQFSVVAGNVLISQVNTKDNNFPYISFLNIYSAWLPASCVIGFLMSVHEAHLIVFGNEYYDSSMLLSYFIVLSVSILNAFKSFIYRVIIGENKNYLSLISNGIWLLLFVGGVYFIENLSLLGFALLYLISSLLSFIVMLPVYLKHKLFSSSEVFFSKTSLYLFSFSIVCFLNGYFIDSINIRLTVFVIMSISLLFSFYQNIKKGMSL
ncbi:hypothetical protein WNY51_04640 [Pseudocolwellia sp. AS88]|uniref:hypothetical protein n=1 Tax=Pseudocolwellia sp. AS88 TaxID=3063958 RepID=UPI0026EB4CB4|nr:hypothetical protein [Pseudocolwellia sp. AS88]MDO7086722.1 hypothetical protein [Pseudocolwellia sp. AS88]